MTLYVVSREDKDKARVRAKEFEIEEAGVAVFYGDPDVPNELNRMTSPDKICAFKDWSEIEQE